MKSLALLFFSPILLLTSVESCCQQPSSGLKRKWELWTRPVLRKRAMEIAQKRLLNILGLDDFPKPGRHVIPHKFMLEIYRNLSSGNYKGNKVSDILPNSVVGIVDQGQFCYLGFFCKCFSLSVFVLHFWLSRVVFLVSLSIASELMML